MSSGSSAPVSECYRFEASVVGNLYQPVSDAGVNESPLPAAAVSWHFPFEKNHQWKMMRRAGVCLHYTSRTLRGTVPVVAMGRVGGMETDDHIPIK